VKVAGVDLTRGPVGDDGAARAILVVRVDATLIEADSSKALAAGTYNR
jgi:hypothetical protein